MYVIYAKIFKMDLWKPVKNLITPGLYIKKSVVLLMEFACSPGLWFFKGENVEWLYVSKKKKKDHNKYEIIYIESEINIYSTHF